MIKRLSRFGGAIKVEHTVFALPFAYVAMVLAAGGWPGWHVAIWVTLALLGARTTAMALNRLIDRAIDARNPRTASRHLPAGLLRPRDMAIGAVAGIVLFFVAAWQLNPLCLILAPLALILLVGYPYTKRFTLASHWILGFTDGIAAAGGWIAVRGHFDSAAFLLWFAVTVWIAGFDLIYACQDVEFDRSEGLHSIPARYGTGVALHLAQLCHLLTILALAALPIFVPLAWPYWIGLLVVSALFVYEHSLVSPGDLSRAGVA
ncbi:MAG TPA: UbiA-like polyprenyltransferase, partial [Bryobacteraceae bacterium]|nr:UbiA-like polyprenyltransferase [Bryobacteraceae bacterium]